MKLFILLTITVLHSLVFPINAFAKCGTVESSEPNAKVCNLGDTQPLSYFACGTNDIGVTCCQTQEECTTGATNPTQPVSIDVLNGPTSDFLDSVNPLKTNGNADLAEQLSTPGGIVSRILQFLFPLAGLALFVMLIWGGFEILLKSSQGTKALDAGKNRITAAIVGFILLFSTYWMAQIIEAVFGIVIV